MKENKSTEDEILEEEYMLGKEYYKKILEKASESKKSMTKNSRIFLEKINK